MRDPGVLADLHNQPPVYRRENPHSYFPPPTEQPDRSKKKNIKKKKEESYK